MITKLGIQARQWLLLFLLLFLPLSVNAAAIWKRIGAHGMLQLLVGTYQPSNPNLPPASLSAILLGLVGDIAFLGFLSWLVFFVSNQVLIQRQRMIAGLFEAALVSMAIAKLFEINAGYFMPLAWLPQFIDSLGVPGSTFAVDWSRWFIFPATAIILFVALALSRNKSLEAR
jgi:hypothetical protein